MWLTLASGILLLAFTLTGYLHLAIYSILAVFSSLIAGVDQPGPRSRVRLLCIILLFCVTSWLVLWTRQLGYPLVFVLFPLIFVFAMFAVRGSWSGRMGTGAMVVAALSLCWPEHRPFWMFPLLIGGGTLWYGVSANLWMLWWGHRGLRDSLGQLFIEIADYYMLKSQFFQKEPDKKQFGQLYVRQEKVYVQINACKDYLNLYGEQSYNSELKSLEKDFLFAVDVMELLQANQHRIVEIREFIQGNELETPYSDLVVAVATVLKRKSYAVRTRRRPDMNIESRFDAFERAIETANTVDNILLAHSLTRQLVLLRNLLGTQEPAFERGLAVPDAPPSLLAAIKPHLNFRSPVLRYALRLSVTVSFGVLVAGWLHLEKSYWVLLAILFVMQSGYILTRTLITQRVLGTLLGAIAGLGIVSLYLTDWQLLGVMAALGLFTFSMLFQHKTLAVSGVTALVVLAYQLIFGSGQEMVFTRAIDTLLGCSLAFVSNLLLWPQWSGGGIKRLLKETLHAQEDILTLCVRSLSDPNIRFEQLSRRRLKLYTAQNNLLASYQQMLREPHHTQLYVDSLERVVGHFVATSAHINGLLPMSRVNVPMTSDLTKHLERLLIAMFSRCDENEPEERLGNIILDDELTCIYHELEEMKASEAEAAHYAIVHLLELIFERLNDIFDILDFCREKDA